MNDTVRQKYSTGKKLTTTLFFTLAVLVGSACSSDEQQAPSPQPTADTRQQSTPTRGLASHNAIGAVFSDPFIKIATIQLKSHIQKLQMYSTFNKGKLPAKECTLHDVEKLTGAIGQTNPRLFKDPWGQPYLYNYHQGTVSSSGPDKVYGPGPTGKTDDLVFKFKN